MQPHEVIEQAIDGHTKGVALRMGKSASYIYKMTAEPEACRYTRFLQAFLAIAAESSEGADLIAEDFMARWRELRQGDRTVEDWFDAVAKTNKETSEAISEAVRDRDPAKIQNEISQAIEALRQLLALEVARAGKSEAGHEPAGSRVRRITGTPRAR